ncbi:Ca(2+)-dependent cysteine protease [Perkinsus olseni]|uniref:Ca(2+)-dependent cysteine protease n=1 Tax=Perkinsus olseni TaxID=32597 RepID=A0A7J6PST6_PEROL|nr:Ca(2+)-dependent cysteine protease [Perkinsus olseni]
MRTEEVQCGMCQQIITLQMPTMRGEPLRARATCPHCQHLNEFDIPALQSTSSFSTAGGSAQSPPATNAPSAAPPMPYSPQSQATAQVPAGVPPQGLTMASQAQYGLPATMQMQQTAVGVPVPELTGVQRALLVGINYYGSKCELSGCIPDVHNMKRLLVETYHWNPNDIKLLTDDGQNEAPTRANIIRNLGWLVRDAKPGDIFFFHYSGHGAQQEDPLHLEEDGMNETIIPVDVKEAGQITDDEIFQILVAPLPSGVRLTSVMDCCHSGTGMDLPWTWVEHRGWNEDVNPWHSRGDVQLFSGCDDSQTSADSSAGPISGGAMTTAFCNAIRARPGVTYVDLIDELNNEMRRKHMSQRPQLSSSQVFPLDRPFNLTDILPNQNKSIGRTVRQKFKARPNENKNKFLRNMLLAGGAGLVGGMLLGEATDDSPRPVVITAPPLIGGPRIDLGGLFGRGGLLAKGKGLL